MHPQGFCEICRRVVNWLHTIEVAMMVGVTEKTVRNWIERGFLHAWEIPSARLLICEQSVLGHGRGKGRRPSPEAKEEDEYRGRNRNL
jgi:hypothetical protein